MSRIILLFSLFFLITACEKNSDPYLAFKQGDYDRAYSGFIRLARAGDLEAQNYVGVMCYLGLGQEKDIRRAKEWFEKAALKGWPGAQFNLANLYRNGEGVTQDFTVAYMWYYAAHKQGYIRATERMKLLLDDHKLFPNQAQLAVDKAEVMLRDLKTEKQ